MAKRAGAKKTAAKKTAAKSARKPAGDPAAALRTALLALVEARGWIDLSFAEIAEQAGVPIGQAHGIYAGKAAILTALTRAVDQRILSGLDADPLEGTAKDRLFDLLMRRFDILKADRGAYRRLMRQLPMTPAEFKAVLCQIRRSLSLTLESAGLSASGVKGELRLQGLTAIYMAGLRAFAGDDSEDLSRTMAELDKRLGQAERVSEMVNRRRSAAA